jgi:WD40 repeat protein
VRHFVSGALVSDFTLSANARSPQALLAARRSLDGEAAAVEALQGAAFAGHAGAVTAVLWLPDGERVASCGDDGCVKVWDAGSGALLRTVFTRRGAILAAGLLATHEEVAVTAHAGGALPPPPPPPLPY